MLDPHCMKHSCGRVFFHNMHILITTDTAQIRKKNSGKIQLYVKEQL